MSEEFKEKIESNYHYQSRLSKLESLQKLGIDAFPAKTSRNIKSEEIQNKYNALVNGEKTQDILHVVGRIMSIRNDCMFIDIYDDNGKIQIYTDIKDIDDQRKTFLENLDLGDFISVEGTIRRTPRGELTINSTDIKIITKTLLPLPEKYHGVHDTELRYRQRYIDLLCNSQSKKNLLKRFQIISLIRNILTKHDFLEVETPMLHPIAGGAIAKPFVTHHNALGTDLYLRIAPELYLKQLIISNLSEKIFEINRCFRNEGISTRHNPEFTSLELYQAYADYQDMMTISELIISHVCQEINSTSVINFGEKLLDFSRPWQRKSMIELVKEKTSIDFMETQTAEEALFAAKNLGINFKGNENWGQIVEKVFAEKVEEFLIQPIHVTDLPTDISPLSKAHAHDKRICERFETYINGWEISNGFSELNDPLEQERRFLMQANARKGGDEEAHHMDEDFITALKHGMPPTGGLGIGLDRLAMLMTDSHSIREIIAFPTLKPKS